MICYIHRSFCDKDLGTLLLKACTQNVNLHPHLRPDLTPNTLFKCNEYSLIFHLKSLDSDRRVNNSCPLIINPTQTVLTSCTFNTSGNCPSTPLYSLSVSIRGSKSLRGCNTNTQI